MSMSSTCSRGRGEEEGAKLLVSSPSQQCTETILPHGNTRKLGGGGGAGDGWRAQPMGCWCQTSLVDPDCGKKEWLVSAAAVASNDDEQRGCIEGWKGGIVPSDLGGIILLLPGAKPEMER